jgi:hypothetical protein
MISNAHLHNQTSVASLNASNETSFNGQQSEDLTKQQTEILAQYHSAKENVSLELQILSQRSYTRGYKGL